VNKDRSQRAITRSQGTVGVVVIYSSSEDTNFTNIYLYSSLLCIPATDILTAHANTPKEEEKGAGEKKNSNKNRQTSAAKRDVKGYDQLEFTKRTIGANTERNPVREISAPVFQQSSLTLRRYV
jgi:hypothetical protein